MDKLRRLINEKRSAFKKFDALPENVKREMTAQGLNPHEPRHIRKAKQAKLKAEIRSKLAADLKDKTPEEREAVFTDLGVSTQDASTVIVRRDTGTIKAK